METELMAFANEVCRDLPGGCELRLTLEKDAGYFDLFDPQGCFVDMEEYSSVDCSVIEQGHHALAYAKKKWGV